MTLPSHGSLARVDYRPDIDGLRAIAVLSVVAFHAFPGRAPGGFVGVDVFFVISGFLISTIILDSLHGDGFSFAEFYARRIRRIFPALLLVLAACFAIGWFILLPDDYKQLGRHVAGGAGFAANLLLWQESGYFDAAAETKPLLHLWSLGVEEQFYIVWPLLLWFVWKKNLNSLTLVAVAAAVSFALSLNKSGSDPVAAFYSPLTRFWELLVGAMLAQTAMRSAASPRACALTPNRWLHRVFHARAPQVDGGMLRNIESLAGTACVVIGVFAVDKERPFPGLWALLPTVGTAMIIHAGAQAWVNRTVLSNRALVWFGLISFPLYLWHWPLLTFARIFEGETPTRGMRLAIVAGSIVLAWLTYVLVERPIRFGKRSKSFPIALSASMLAVGYIGYNCYQRDGLGFRFDGVIRELVSYHYDYSRAYREGTCFLDFSKGQNYSTFDRCPSYPPADLRPSILLWGDSHAAHLHPGYAASYGRDYRVIQRTAGGCPPLLGGVGGPPCAELNAKILDFIKAERPTKAVLAAWWAQGYGFHKIEETVVELRQAGVNDIVLVGPVPQWIDGLPKQLYRKVVADSFHRVPERMTTGLDLKVFELDARMARLATQLGVTYVSPTAILCNVDGCITRVGKSGDTLAAKDGTHLTEASSLFLVSQFPGASPTKATGSDTR